MTLILHLSLISTCKIQVTFYYYAKYSITDNYVIVELLYSYIIVLIRSLRAYSVGWGSGWNTQDVLVRPTLLQLSLISPFIASKSIKAAVLLNCICVRKTAGFDSPTYRGFCSLSLCD